MNDAAIAAIRSKDLGAVKKLLAKGFDPNDGAPPIGSSYGFQVAGRTRSPRAVDGGTQN